VDTANGLQIHYQGVSHQTTDNGSRIEGILTLTEKDLSGVTLCVSTYDVVAVRQ
jgi:hypothetical protein